MNTVNLRPLSEHVGVEAVGIDLNTVEDQGFGALRKAVAERGVLFVRDQEMTPEQHIAFARRWGGIDINNYFPANGGHAEIAEVRKSETQTTNIGGGWHTDHSYDQVPAMGSILLARETPPTGGDTLFASLGAAYDALSDDLKSQVENLRAVHSADHVYSADGVYAKTDLADDLKGHDIRTRAVHPVVIRHPVTGRRILYVNPAFTLHFEGWSQADSMPLLYELYAIALRKEFQCRLSWAPGAIAIWDNRSTWHFANNDYQGHRRLMHRITISGVPVGA